MLRGLGAGGASTASAVVSDVVNGGAGARRRAAPLRSRRTGEMTVLGDEDVEVAGYVRASPESTRADARALVLQALEDRGLAVDAAVDLPGTELIVLTGVGAAGGARPRDRDARHADVGRRHRSARSTGSRPGRRR